MKTGLDKLWGDYINLRCCFVAAFVASSLMIFLVVWFGGVSITIVVEEPRRPATVGELVETLEAVALETPLETNNR